MLMLIISCGNRLGHIDRSRSIATVSYFLSVRSAANIYQLTHKGITHATFTLFRSFDVSMMMFGVLILFVL